MALGNRYQVGVGSVGSYQISGIPWVQTHVIPATTITEVTFAPDGTNPYVTRFVKLRNTASTGAVQVGLHANGITGSTAGAQPWFTLPANMTSWLHLEVRVSSLYFSASAERDAVEIIAGLTPIQNDFTENIAAYRGVGTGSI